MQNSPSIHIFERNDLEKGGAGSMRNRGDTFNESAKEVNDLLIEKTLEGTFRRYLHYSDESGATKTGLSTLIKDDGTARINAGDVTEKIIQEAEKKSQGKLSEQQKEKIRKSVTGFMISVHENSTILKRALYNKEIIKNLNELKNKLGSFADGVQSWISDLLKKQGELGKILSKKDLTKLDRQNLINIITSSFGSSTLLEYAGNQYSKIDGKQKLLNLIIDILHITVQKGSFKSDYETAKNTFVIAALNTYKTGETQTARVGNLAINTTNLSLEKSKSAKEKGDTTTSAIQVTLANRSKEKLEENKKLLVDVLGGEKNFHEFILYLGVTGKKWALYTEQSPEVRGIIDSIYETYKNPVEQKYTKDIFGKDYTKIEKLRQLNKIQPIKIDGQSEISIEQLRGKDIVAFAKSLGTNDSKEMTRKLNIISKEINKRIGETIKDIKKIGDALGKYRVDDLNMLGDRYGVKLPEGLSKHKGKSLRNILTTLSEIDTKELEVFLLSLEGKLENTSDRKLIRDSLELISKGKANNQLHQAKNVIDSQQSDILIKAIQGDKQAQQFAMSTAIAAENIGRNQGSISTVEAITGLDLSNPANIEILRKQAGNNPDIQYLIEYARTEHKEIAEQIRIYEKEYGKAAAEKLYNSSTTAQKNGYNQYEFLDKNVYRVNHTSNQLLDTTLLHLETGKTINLVWENGENGGPKTYQVTSLGEGKYNISIPELGQTIEGLRFTEIQNAIGETQVLHNCGMDIFTPYIKEINEYNNKNGGKKIELQDRTFSEQESIAIIEQIGKLLNLPEPNTNDRSSLGNMMSYIRRLHENSVDHMFNSISITSWIKSIGQKAGIIDDTGNIKKQNLITLLGKG